MNTQAHWRETLQRHPRGALALALLAAGFVATVGAQDAAPAITPILTGTPVTEAFRYPDHMRVGDSDGAYRQAVVFRSKSAAGGRVGLWESNAGTLRSDGYPSDEFVHVIEGELETVDQDGTTKTFGPGASFVIPKGWVGEWRMSTTFKKVFVNF